MIRTAFGSTMTHRVTIRKVLEQSIRSPELGRRAGPVDTSGWARQKLPFSRIMSQILSPRPHSNTASEFIHTTAGQLWQCYATATRHKEYRHRRPLDHGPAAYRKNSVGSDQSQAREPFAAPGMPVAGQIADSATDLGGGIGVVHQPDVECLHRAPQSR